MDNILNRIKEDATAVVDEIIEKTKLQEGDIFIVGCSSSEMIGNLMGTSADGETDAAVDILYAVITERLDSLGVNLAVQCCEHLNRAVVIDKSVAVSRGYEIVNVIPQPHAGGAFAVKHFKSLNEPAVVEDIRHEAVVGLDIGGVLIGMHIRPVVVPLRMEHKRIGEASVIAGRYRPKYIGGSRAVYDAELQ